MKLVLRSAALLVAGALSACVGITAAPAGPYAAGASTVTLGRTWSDMSAVMRDKPERVRVLSIDGPTLNRLYLTEGLQPGDPLVRAADREHPTPAWRADMSSSELVEFVSESVASLGYLRPTTANIRGQTVGGAEGIRFDLTAASSDGLDASGTAWVGEQDGKLFVMLYLAPTEHYYAANLPEVERIIASTAMRR